MNRRAVVTAPGKLILMGEHAAVYGQPALIAAADPRARVEVEATDRNLLVDLADFDRVLQTDWVVARERAESSRRAWQRYAESPTPERFAEVGSGSPEDLALVALGELARAINSATLPPLAIRIKSSLPIGSGFGSSASIAVALIGGVLTWIEGVAEPDLVDTVALEVERRLHGFPSGVDHKTVLHGGVVLAQRRSADDLHISSLTQTSPALSRLQVYQTGRPAEMTGEVVAAVRKYRDASPAEVDSQFEDMGRLVRSFCEALTAPEDRYQEFNELIREYERRLENLGVVPVAVRETIREVEAAGGGAKISGAGSLTGSAAGCLLVDWPIGPPARLPTGLAESQRMNVELGVEGLRVEDDQ